MSKSSHKSTKTPATVALDQAKAVYRLHSYQHDPRSHNFGEEAALALDIDPAQTFKTLIVELTGGPNRLVTAVVPAAGMLDLKAIAQAGQAKKATLADPSLAQRTTGFVVGGISPLGQKHQTPVFIDASAKQYPIIYVSAGRRGFSVEISPDELARVTHANFVALGRAEFH